MPGVQWIVYTLLTLGLALSLAGHYGRRIDDHPYCSKCRYDLTGRIDPDKNFATFTCPECGRDIGPGGGFRVGRRAKRPGLRWTGLGLTMLGIVLMLSANPPLGLASWVQKHKPERLLLFESGGGSQAATSELAQRLTDAELSDETRIRLTDQLLVRLSAEGGLDPAWEPILVETAIKPGPIDESHEAAIIDALTETRLVLTERVAPGSQFTWGVWVRLRDKFEGDLAMGALRFETTRRAVVPEHEFVIGGSMMNSGTLAAEHRPTGGHTVRNETPIGRYPLEFELEIIIGNLSSTSSLRSEVEVAAVVEPRAGALITNPALDKRLLESVTLRMFRIERPPTPFLQGSCHSLDYRNPEVPVIADVIFRGGGEEVVVGRFDLQNTDSGVSSGAFCGPELPDTFGPGKIEVVDVLIRPNPWRFGFDPESPPIFGKTIVFENVRLGWKDPAGAPLNDDFDEVSEPTGLEEWSSQP